MTHMTLFTINSIPEAFAFMEDNCRYASKNWRKEIPNTIILMEIIENYNYLYYGSIVEVWPATNFC